MNKCICGKELTGKQKYCSDACRKKASRTSRTETDGASVTNVTVGVPNDDPWSPTFDLTEAGFIRRNKNWNDDGTYPGTAASRKDCMQVSQDIHADRQREIADTVKRRIEIAAEAINDPHIIGQQRMGA